LFVLFLYFNPTDNSDAGGNGWDFIATLVRPRILCCWLSWPLILAIQSGGRKLTYITMVVIHNSHVEWHGHCTLQQVSENCFKPCCYSYQGLMKNEFCWPSLILIQPSEVWKIFTHMMVETLTVAFGQIHTWMYCNCW
jgi:hypothetical protein